MQHRYASSDPLGTTDPLHVVSKGSDKAVAQDSDSDVCCGALWSLLPSENVFGLRVEGLGKASALSIQVGISSRSARLS